MLELLVWYSLMRKEMDSYTLNNKETLFLILKIDLVCIYLPSVMYFFSDQPLSE